MTAFRVFRSSSPLGAASSPVLPMSKEDQSFWSMLRARRPQLYARHHANKAAGQSDA
jgi:hypothetical protein